MITNTIAQWRASMNHGKGISKAHLARRVGVSRSFVTKLEKGTAQPGAEFMLRVAVYFKQPVEEIFTLGGESGGKHDSTSSHALPESQFHNAHSEISSARPAGSKIVKDKSLVSPTAKEVASLSRSKPKTKT